MDLLRKAFVFILIGLANCQIQFDNMEQFNAHLQQQINSGQFDPNMFNFNKPSQGGRQPLGGVNDGQLMQILEQGMHGVHLSIKQKCEQAGKAEIANNLENTFAETFKCINDTVQFENIMSDFVKAGRTGQLQDFFGKLCIIWPQLHKCINKIVKDAEECMEKEDRDAIEISISLLDDTNTFFCENNADRLIKFINEKGGDCITQSNAGLTKCGKDVVSQKKAKEGKVLPVSYDSEDCKDFITLRQCSVNEMKKCPSSVPSQIVDDYLALIQKKVCNSASTLSWFSSINILLVLCTYLYSKIF